MKEIQTAEAHVLDRMLHLLEEGSVAHLMQQDMRFAAYIDNLYEKLAAKSTHIRQGV